MKTNRYPGKDKILNSIVRQVVSAASPEKIILFGSRAKGINGNESDYDICTGN
ncbi:MAG: nucleotidyltransferase domain-containing protein [Bacteroidetes bacterium]|nr:nucleotidyltransferase domain-containing protein [Bacteroidota bacterium]